MRLLTPCEVYRVSRLPDGQGGWSEEYALAGETTCSVQDVRGGRAQEEQGGQERTLIRHVVWLPQDADVKPNDLLRFKDGSQLEITGVSPPRGRLGLGPAPRRMDAKRYERQR